MRGHEGQDMDDNYMVNILDLDKKPIGCFFNLFISGLLTVNMCKTKQKLEVITKSGTGVINLIYHHLSKHFKCVFKTTTVLIYYKLIRH